MLGITLTMLYRLADKRTTGFHLCMAGASLFELWGEVGLLVTFFL